MIEFFADDHFGQHCGKNLYDRLPEGLRHRIAFHENDMTYLNSGSWEPACELLILHMIGGTCGQPLAEAGAEDAVKKYCARGGSLLLLHGSSAAFWHWAWWRELVGFRWVRPNDPDHVPSSTHPVRPFSLFVNKTRHALTAKLKPFELPKDEIYIELEQTAPMTVLMSTKTEEGTYPQCVECAKPGGGLVVSFIPGHTPAAFERPELAGNVAEIIRYLLASSR